MAENKVIPTERQKRAFARVVENQGNISKSMREAGYPATTAKNPKNLTDSKAWQQLLKEKMPDDLLAEKHLELLNAKATIIKDDGTVIKTDATDFNSMTKGLDMAYKVKGRYINEIDDNFSPTQIIIKALENVLEKKLIKDETNN